MATGNTEGNFYYRPIDDLPNIQLTPEFLTQILNIIRRLNEHPMRLTPNDMCYELLRLFAFMICFPRNRGLDLHAFASAGFYPAGDRDYVACYCCGLHKGNWATTDIPREVHRRLSPNCDFFRGNRRVNTPFILSTEESLRQAFETTAVIGPVPTGPALVRSEDEVQRPIIRVIDRTRQQSNDQIEYLNVLPVPDFISHTDGDLHFFLDIVITQADLNIALRESDGVQGSPEITLVSSSDSFVSSVDRQTAIIRLSSDITEEDGNIQTHSQSMSARMHYDRDNSAETELKAPFRRGAGTKETVSVEVSDHENIYVNADSVHETSRLPENGSSQTSNEAIGDQTIINSNLSEHTNEKKNGSLSVTERQLEKQTETAASYAIDVSPASGADETLRKHSTDSAEPGVISDNANDIFGKQQEKDNTITEDDQGALSKEKLDKKPSSIPRTHSIKTLCNSSDGRSTSKEDAKEDYTEHSNISDLEGEESSTGSDHAVDQSRNYASAFGELAQIDKNEEVPPSTSKMQSKRTTGCSSDIRSASKQDTNVREASSNHSDSNNIESEEPSISSDRSISQPLNDATASDDSGQIEKNYEFPPSLSRMQSKKTPTCSSDNRSVSKENADTENDSSNRIDTNNLEGEEPSTSNGLAIGRPLCDSTASGGQFEKNEEPPPSTSRMQSGKRPACISDSRSASREEVNIREDSSHRIDTNNFECEEPPTSSDHAVGKLLHDSTASEESRQIGKNEESLQSTPIMQSEKTPGSSDIRQVSILKVDANIKEDSTENIDTNNLEGEAPSPSSDHAIGQLVNRTTDTEDSGQIDKKIEESLPSTPIIQLKQTLGCTSDIQPASKQDINIKEDSAEHSDTNNLEGEDTSTGSDHAISVPLNESTATEDKIIPVLERYTQITESTLSKGTIDNSVGVHNSVTYVKHERNNPASIGQRQHRDSCSIIRASEMHPEMQPARRQHVSAGSTIYEEPEKDVSEEQSISRTGTGKSYRRLTCNTNSPVTRQSAKTDNKLNCNAFNVSLRQTGNLRDDPTCNIHRRRTRSESSYFEDDEDFPTYKEDINPKEIFKDGTLKQQASVEYAVSTTGEHREKHQASLREKESCSNSQDKENEEMSNLITEHLKMIRDPGTKQRLLHKFLEDIEQAKMGNIPEQ